MSLRSLVHQGGLYKRITYSESFSSLGFLDPNIPHVFGGQWARGAIVERTQRLGLLVNKSWSEAEMQNVRDHRHLKLKEFSAQFWSKFGYDLTYKTIKERRTLESAHKDD